MRNFMVRPLLSLLLIFFTTLAHAGPWDTFVDGRSRGEVDVIDFDDQPTAPAVSAANHARVYYDDGVGSLMQSLDGGAYSALGGGGLADVVDDTTPQLGGNLDVNGNIITSATNGDVTLDPHGSGTLNLNAGSGGVSIVTDAGNSDITLDAHGSGAILVKDNLTVGDNSSGDATITFDSDTGDDLDVLWEETADALLVNFDTTGGVPSIGSFEDFRLVDTASSSAVVGIATVAGTSGSSWLRYATSADNFEGGLRYDHAFDNFEIFVANNSFLSLGLSDTLFEITDGSNNSFLEADFSGNDVTINPDGDPNDFYIETDTVTNALFIDGGNEDASWNIPQTFNSPVTSEVQMVVFDFTTANATGDGKFYFHIGPKIGSSNLTGAHAEVITAGTTGTLDIQIHNVTNAVDMLSTKLTIDTGETGSDTAATPAVINATNDDVDENDLVRVDVDAIHTTPAQGLLLTLEFDPR